MIRNKRQYTLDLRREIILDSIEGRRNKRCRYRIISGGGWRKLGFFTVLIALLVLILQIPNKIQVTNNYYFEDVINIEVPKKEIRAEVSAYNPLPSQTDSTPDINAMGFKVREGDIANNCLAFETKVEIDGKIYTVRDRMNRRYGCEHFDILMMDYKEALKFGRQLKQIKIHE